MIRNVLLIITIVFLLGCAQEKSQNVEISFTIDESLLAKEVSIAEIGVKFLPPVHWEEIDAENLNIVQSKILESQDSTKIDPFPIKIFMDKERSSTCFVFSLTSTLLAEDASENYLTDFRTAKQDINFNEGNFSHNSIDFKQVTYIEKINDKDFTSVKLIANVIEQKVFIIEYIVSSHYYQNELRSIESSIGTIQKIK